MKHFLSPVSNSDRLKKDFAKRECSINNFNLLKWDSWNLFLLFYFLQLDFQFTQPSVLVKMTLQKIPKVQIGRELPKASRRLGQSFGMGYNYFKVLLKLLTPQTQQPGETMDVFRKANQQVKRLQEVSGLNINIGSSFFERIENKFDKITTYV